MKWFRYYSESAQDGKVQRLPAALFRYWVNILALANEGKPRGRLPGMGDIAFWLHVSIPKAEKIITELIDRELIDQVDSRLVPHNWDERQPSSDNVAARVKRYRDRASNVTCNNPEQNREEQNRTDKKREETEEENIFRLYEQTIGPFDPHMATKLEEAEKEYSAECVRHSFQEASENNARSWRYVETILKAHKSGGCYSGKRCEHDPATDTLERHERQMNEKTRA